MNVEIIISLIALCGVIFSTLGAFLGSYLGYKITRRISKTERYDRYAFAALDKRLLAHQEAYYHIHKLWQSEEGKEIESLNISYEWYLKNCLYLDKDSKEIFLAFMINYRTYKMLAKNSGKKNILFYKCQDLLEATLKTLSENVGVSWNKEEIIKQIELK